MSELSRSTALPRMVNLPLRDWTRLARSHTSRVDYLEGVALPVAVRLTNHLHEKFRKARSGPSRSSANGAAGSGAEKSGSSLRIEDIVPGNVVVAVVANGDSHGAGVDFMKPTGVDIVSKRSRRGDKTVSDASELEQRDVCFALGRICFELFSPGESLPAHETLSADSNQDDLFKNLQLGGNDADTPASKRSSFPGVNRVRQAASLRATAHLQGGGLPRSICQLVSDLLEAERGNPYFPVTAMVSLDEVQYDLKQMIAHPQRFLYDQTSPKSALENTALFDQMDGELYGRDAEMDILLTKAALVSMHVPSQSGVSLKGIVQTANFMCEAIFLSGHSGSGKSTIMRQLVSHCNATNWFVLTCKFDRQVSPLSALLQSFDFFFGGFTHVRGLDGNPLPRAPLIQESFDRISKSIIDSVNTRECFLQLCELLPNSFSELFPNSTNYVQGTAQTINSGFSNKANSDVLGSGISRLQYLLRIVFKALCSGGLPVSMVLDDLQWCDEFTVNILGELIEGAAHSSDLSANQESNSEMGLLIVGSFRDNEVDQDGFLLNQIRCMEVSSSINVTKICVGELRENEINKMISFKFCLPTRHTKELAQLIHSKTRGHCLYTLEFLRSIIQKNLVSFSVKARRWTWDDDAINMEMMSEGVVELLKRNLCRLPSQVVETLKVISCIGQINESTVELLDSGQIVANMTDALNLAVKEGILDKSGPLFAFSHDMLQESTYNLMQIYEQKALHKEIGKTLANGPRVEQNAELCLLAADQINMCKDADGLLDPVDRSVYARLNLSAGKHSIASSSFEQALTHFEAGISLLNANPWSAQYSLCLKLYEMSMGVSFVLGNLDMVSTRVDTILANATSFNDTVHARAISAKLLISQGQHAIATNELLGILSSKLGDDFPCDIAFSDVTNEINDMMPMLKLITKETILELPKMADATKLTAMRLMGLLITMCQFSSPLLVPFLCSRMIKHSFEFGFSEDTIVAIGFASFVVVHYTEDVELVKQLSKTAEFLISGNLNETSLRARLCSMLCSTRCYFEPFQSVSNYALKGYNSAKIIGDTDNAMLCGLMYCLGYSFSISDLVGLQKNLINFLLQMAKLERLNISRSAMSFLDCASALIGRDNCADIMMADTILAIKTNMELYQIAKQTKNAYLLHHVVINRMTVACYFRQYNVVVDLAKEYGGCMQGKRVLDFYCSFFEGIASLCLARSTREDAWREIGERSIKTMLQLESYCTWNFGNKLALLQAELHYLDKRHSIAKVAYLAAIHSANKHRFYHEAGLAHECYGIYLIENKNVANGLEQLEKAKEKYEKWGALSKVQDVNMTIAQYN